MEMKIKNVHRFRVVNLICVHILENAKIFVVFTCAKKSFL